MGGGAEVDGRPAARPRSTCWAVLRNATQADARAAIEAARGRGAGLGGAVASTTGPRSCSRRPTCSPGPWRQRLNAATMLGQSKTAFQAEIDAACELIDFWRFNVHFARQILAEQPIANARGIWNRTDHRPLEGFVYAITPFNFTAIAGNLPTAPALMGNTVLWKPSPTQQVAAHLTMELLEEAGLPPGVINMLPGDGLDVSEVALDHPDLAGIHFTGSTPTFQHLWRTVGENIATYRSYPRIVGETGGKDFVVAHPSADPDVLRAALLRGAFEFQGQKCSAASRAYVAALGLEADARRLRRRGRRASRWATSPTSRTSWARSSTTARSPSTRRRSPARSARPEPRRSWPAARSTTRSATSSGRRSSRARDPTDEMFTHRVLRPDPRRARLRRPRLRAGRRPDGVASRRTPSPARSSPRTATSIAWAARAAAVRRRQLLHQRQADRRRRRPAAVRRRAGPRAPTTRPARRANLLRWTSPRSIKETFDPPTDYRYPYMDSADLG